MEVFLLRALQLILSLSILVLIHEFGHFIFSRIFGVRVEKFYMFFNPLFSILRAKKVGHKWHFSWFSRKSPEVFNTVPEKTEFGIGWVPLGGYCSISGMIDESMNVSQMAEPEKPWEFRSQPAWKRLLIMVGGVLFNFILALFLYASILNIWGEEYLPLQNAPMGMEFSPAAQEIGFKDGDKLLYADGVAFDRLTEETLRTIIEASDVTVLRAGQKVEIKIPSDFMQRIMKAKEGFVAFRYPAVVKDVMPGSPAKKCGLLPGDSLTAINGITVATFSDFTAALLKYKDKPISLSYFRNGIPMNVSVQPDENGKLGFYTRHFSEIFKTKKVEYSFFASIPAGIRKGIAKLTGYASDMKYVFTKEGAKSLGGFGAIGSLFPPVWSWEIFWETTAFLSIILAFMNILPIPALDGGHILFLLVEVVTRRKPGVKFLEYAQMVGMFLLLALLVYANGNDIYRIFFK
jgi:regulator of sigma E protease